MLVLIARLILIRAEEVVFVAKECCHLSIEEKKKRQTEGKMFFLKSTQGNAISVQQEGAAGEVGVIVPSSQTSPVNPDLSHKKKEKINQ